MVGCASFLVEKDLGSLIGKPFFSRRLMDKSVGKSRRCFVGSGSISFKALSWQTLLMLVLALPHASSDASWPFCSAPSLRH